MEGTATQNDATAKAPKARPGDRVAVIVRVPAWWEPIDPLTWPPDDGKVIATYPDSTDQQGNFASCRARDLNSTFLSRKWWGPRDIWSVWMMLVDVEAGLPVARLVQRDDGQGVDIEFVEQ